MEWIGIISISIGFYILGYDARAKGILKQWKLWNRGYYGEVSDSECIHGDTYEYCPDCRH